MADDVTGLSMSADPCLGSPVSPLKFKLTIAFEGSAYHGWQSQKSGCRARISRCPKITFVVEGEGFLYKMCRCIVGTLVQVGYGRFSADDVSSMLARHDRRVSGMNAPAHGLVLWKVFFPTKPPGIKGTSDASTVLPENSDGV